MLSLPLAAVTTRSDSSSAKGGQANGVRMGGGRGTGTATAVAPTTGPKTDIQEALGGAEYFQRRTPFRVARFGLDWMTEDEGMSNAFEIDRRAGLDQEIFYIFDTADTVHALRRRFIARLRQLSQIEFPYQNVNKRAYEVKELL